MPLLNPLENFAQATGVAFEPYTSRQGVVLETEELRRIRDMPRYDWEADPAIEYFRQELTRILKRNGGTQELRPAQAAAIKAFVEVGGLMGAMRVGSGKTLVSFLSFVLFQMLGQGAQRPLIIVPASLQQKTRDDCLRDSHNWLVRPFTLVSYEKLSRDYCRASEDEDSAVEKGSPVDRYGEILGGLQPDLVFCDEAHKLKNTKNACWRKLRRYFQYKQREGVLVRKAFVSGTFTNKSLRDYWHLASWALGDGSPLPRKLDEFKGWSLALDDRVPQEMRYLPGALERLSPNPQGVDSLERARDAYKTRFISTPGVVSTKEDRPSMSLVIHAKELPAPENVKAAIRYMRETWCTPDEHPFEMATQLWAHANEAQCGFYYVWDPRPPQSYIEARRAWNTFMREKLKASQVMDSPGALVQRITKGLVPDGGLYAEWCKERDAFGKPNTVPRWIDDATLQYCKKWLHSHPKGLCWVGHGAFGRALEAISGVPYFAKKGLDSRGIFIEKHTGPAIVSVKACREGLNLQHKWCENLFPYVMSTPDAWEQTLGRTHRDNQPEDEVTAEILMMSRESYSSLIYAIRGAEYTQETTGAPQKLCYATRDLGQVEKLISRRDDDMWKEEIGI